MLRLIKNLFRAGIESSSLNTPDTSLSLPQGVLDFFLLMSFYTVKAPKTGTNTAMIWNTWDKDCIGDILYYFIVLCTVLLKGWHRGSHLTAWRTSHSCMDLLWSFLGGWMGFLHLYKYICSIFKKEISDNVRGHFSKLCSRSSIHHHRFCLLWCCAVQPFEPSPPPRSCLLFTGTVCFPLQAQLRAANCSSSAPPSLLRLLL